MHDLSWRRGALAALLLLLAMTPLATTSAFAASATVTIGSTLSTRELTVAPGTTVVWRNVDDERHRIRSRTGPTEFDSGNIEPGGTFRVTLTQVGRYPYLDDRNRDASAYWGSIVVARGSATATPPPGGGASGGATGGAPTTSLVTIAGRAFSPATTTIVAGSTVRFRNDDGRDHTVSATGGAFESGVLGGGSTFSRRFPTPGTFRYLCRIHPEMTGRIVVRGGSTSTAPAPTPKPDGSPAGGGTPSTPGAASGSTGTAVQARIVDLAFAPTTVRVTVGASVTWTNDDQAIHSVTSASGGWDSGIVDPGASWTHTFATVGSFAFACSIHPTMQGRVVVGPSGRGSTTAPPSTPETRVEPSPSSSPPAGVAAPGSGEASRSTSPDSAPTVGANDSTRGDANALVRLGLVGFVWIAAIGGLAAVVRGTARRP